MHNFAIAICSLGARVAAHTRASPHAISNACGRKQIAVADGGGSDGGAVASSGRRPPAPACRPQNPNN